MFNKRAGIVKKRAGIAHEGGNSSSRKDLRAGIAHW
jgi:hypothetical protein